MNAILFDVICRREQGLSPAVASLHQTTGRKKNRRTSRRESLCDNWDRSLAADCIAKTPGETDLALAMSSTSEATVTNLLGARTSSSAMSAQREKGSGKLSPLRTLCGRDVRAPSVSGSSSCLCVLAPLRDFCLHAQAQRPLRSATSISAESLFRRSGLCPKIDLSRNEPASTGNALARLSAQRETVTWSVLRKRAGEGARAPSFSLSVLPQHFWARPPLSSPT